MTKINKLVYWIATLWLASGMLATGTLQLFKAKAEGALAPPGVFGITHLGYPVYFLTILGVWKILGVVAKDHFSCSELITQARSFFTESQAGQEELKT